MIEKFLEKFLPQITERVNENAELGQALIETLAVLDNYATLNNVQFTDEQINAMLGVVPEPEPEPVIDISAQIVELVEKKKGNSKPKKWDWRFKTEQELRTDVPKLEWEGWWNNEKKYLSGQKIKFSAAGKKYFEDYVFTKKDASEVPVVDTKEYFGVTSGDDDVWTVVYQMVTQDPLPTELETTTPAAPDMFWGYIQDFNSRFPNKINSFELRYSYMTWEELMGYYEKADDKFKDEFIKSVYIVLRNSRLLTIYTETQVRQAILDNEPTPDMLELFSNNYYFVPQLVNFYLSNYYQIGIDKAIQKERTSKGIVTDTKLNELICVSIDSEVLNTVNRQERGYCGLGSALSNNQIFYPDIITTDWTGAISKAYNAKKADNIGQVNLTQILENAYYDSSVGLKSNFNGTDIMSSFVPLAISYNRTAYEYKDIYQVKSDWIYIQNKKSNLDSYISNTKLYGENEYVFPPFLKNILEPICVLTDYDELVYQFEKNGFIDSQQASELLVIGNQMQFRGSGGENLYFFQCVVNNSLANTTTIRIVERLKQYRGLDTEQVGLLYDFINLFFYKVVSPSSQFVLSEYEKKTEGATTQITQVTQPTATAWSWRFKTEEEFINEYGDDWKEEVNWSSSNGMDYLLGEEIAETSNSRDVISLLQKQKGINYDAINTFRDLGITSGGDDDWVLQMTMLTNEPLPKVILTRGQPLTQPINTAWSWRFKTEQEFKDEYGIDWVDSMPSNIIWGTYGSKDMSFLFGQPILQTPVAEKIIKDLVNGLQNFRTVNVREYFGIKNPNIYADEEFNIPLDFLTQQPLPTAAATTTWNWRFKTLDEFVEEYGDDWVDKVDWLGDGEMDYLLGQEIAETTESKEAIKELTARTSSKVLNTFDVLGITSGGRDLFRINTDMLINKPLPTATPKKRGRKPKTTWNWRFKTQDEIESEYGFVWRNKWGSNGRDYLFGQPIPETSETIEFIDNLLGDKIESNKDVDTKELFGLDSGKGERYNSWYIPDTMLTNKPLPTTAAPAKSEPKKRGRKPKSELPEIDLGGLEDIGDIDIDDIDFDNLVI